MRLIGVVHKAGQRPEHREMHRHLGRAVSLVSYDAVPLELADESPRSRPVSSLGRAVVADLRLALGEHRYMVTPKRRRPVGRQLGHRRRSSQCGTGQERHERAPGGIFWFALFAAARPSKRANKSNRITDVFRDLPRPPAVALSHLLLGTDHHPEAALLWRHLSGLSPLGVPAAHRGGLAGRSALTVSEHPVLFRTPPQAHARSVPQGGRPPPGLRNGLSERPGRLEGAIAI